MHNAFRYGAMAFLLAALASAGPASGQTTERVSESTAGVQIGQDSRYPVISADGRYVAFVTDAALVASDTNDDTDIYVRDLTANTTERVTLSSTGVEPDDFSTPTAISNGGRYLLFDSYASNLVPNDTNDENDVFLRDRLQNTTVRVSVDHAGLETPFGASAGDMTPDGRYVTLHAPGRLTSNDANPYSDVYRRDMVTGTIVLISLSSTGSPGDDHSAVSQISANGRYVVFGSHATNLVPNDFNDRHDVFLRDTVANTTVRVSQHANGGSFTQDSSLGGISGDGRYVAFTTSATGVVPNDTNGSSDVFVRDMQSGATERVSVNDAGVQGDGDSYGAGLSADGRYVLIGSSARNLAANDTSIAPDMFLRDRVANTTRLVSVAHTGSATLGDVFEGRLSGNGQRAVFATDAGDILPGDVNQATDIFARDLVTNTTALVSVGDIGRPGDGASNAAAIDGDGRRIVFASTSRNFMPNDLSGVTKIFLRDRVAKTTVRADLNAAGQPGNNTALAPAISANGQVIAFTSFANNLVPGDTNTTWDIFARNLSTNAVTRVSVSSAGVQADGRSDTAALSADGRYVAFSSLATNLVAGDTNGMRDIFVRDTVANTTVRVSVATDGTQANDHCYVPDISGDGRYVTWYSPATNLVPGDTNGVMDVFVRDMQTGTTRRVSVSSTGTQGNADSALPRISRNGRYVAFYGSASNLVAGDTNSAFDVFVHDLTTNATRRVSLTSTGDQANASSSYPRINADGTRIVFHSAAQNLVPGKTNASTDVFVRDVTASTTRRVSVSTTGAEGDGHSTMAVISGEGQYVAFESVATTLVPGDTDLRDVFVHGPLDGDGAFTIADAAKALRAAGGLLSSGEDTTRLNVVDTGASSGRVDIADAVRIARKAAGLEN